MASVSAPLPRVTIQFCTQCKWMLRAAYFAQELLSTFGTTLAEVALQPSTGGTFIVSLQSSISSRESEIQLQHHVLWDRKLEGGFPETKELKKRVRDIIEPGRDLGHVDGKKESVPGVNPDFAEYGQEESTRGLYLPKEMNHRQKTEEQQDVQRLHATSNLQAQEQESKSEFAPIDVHRIEVKNEQEKSVARRNRESGVCEECL